MQAIAEANTEHTVAYGDDEWTHRAEDAVRELLGEKELQPMFVFNGTGANVVALQACLLPFHSIICASTAHIAVDECGAPAKFTGCVLKEIVTPDGKLTPNWFDRFCTVSDSSITATQGYCHIANNRTGNGLHPWRVESTCRFGSRARYVPFRRWHTNGQCMRQFRCFIARNNG